jgi:RTX calcium-binding nonapeptide repeat (4 copies)
VRLVALCILLALIAAAAAGARVVTGTARNDRLVGTPSADVIRGLAGNDQLFGRGGADFIQGGPGRDTIDAGAGGDLVAVSYDGARDTTRCGSGLDVVNADLTDTVARDCELVGRRLSRDPYQSTDAQHETEVEPDSFTFGRMTVATFQVGRRVDGGATNVGYAVTTDDGATWRSGLLPGLTVASVPAGPNQRESDPVVAYDAAHGTWLISTLALEGGITRLAVNRSPNGTTWSSSLAAAEENAAGGDEGIGFDKNWLTCDNTQSSPFYGRCYLVYTHSADRDMLAVRWSNDGGLTWSTAVDIGARPAVGVFPAIRPTGEVVVVYFWETGRSAIASSRSSDGGATWAAPVRIADIRNSCAIPDFRAFPLPAADVDHNGRIWATWHDCVPGGSSNAVYVSTSDDGAAWTEPTAVTRNRNAVLPAIGIDPGTGRVAIAYLRSGARGVDADLVESPGPVSSFRAPRRLSAEASALPSMARTASGRMLGDYISVHFSSGRPLVVWVLALTPINGAFREAVYATRG